MKNIDKLKRQRAELEYQLQQLEAPDIADRDMDWFDEWTYLQSHITGLTQKIEQEESWQASSR